MGVDGLDGFHHAPLFTEAISPAFENGLKNVLQWAAQVFPLGFAQDFENRECDVGFFFAIDAEPKGTLDAALKFAERAKV